MAIGSIEVMRSESESERFDVPGAVDGCNVEKEIIISALK